MKKPWHSRADRGRRPAWRSNLANQAAFSLIELLTVISIIGVLAAIGVGLATTASRKSKESAVRAERDRLVTAISSYFFDFNQYPPDNARDGQNVNTVVHPLYYELTGTISSQQGRTYQTDDGAEQITSAQVRQAFNQNGFLNSTTGSDRPKNFLGQLKERQRQTIAVGSVPQVTLLAVPVEWPANKPGLKEQAPLRGLVADDRLLRVNPWQYNSTRPLRNQQSYDLWADLVIGKQRITIGNWKEN